MWFMEHQGIQCPVLLWTLAHSLYASPFVYILEKKLGISFSLSIFLYAAR